MILRNDSYDNLLKVAMRVANKYALLKHLNFVLSPIKDNNPVEAFIEFDDRIICSGNIAATGQFALVFNYVTDTNNTSENVIQTKSAVDEDTGIIYIYIYFVNWMNKGNIVNPYAEPKALTDKIKILDIKSPNDEQSRGLYIDIKALGSLVVGIDVSVNIYYDVSDQHVQQSAIDDSEEESNIEQESVTESTSEPEEALDTESEVQPEGESNNG